MSLHRVHTRRNRARARIGLAGFTRSSAILCLTLAGLPGTSLGQEYRSADHLGLAIPDGSPDTPLEHTIVIEDEGIVSVTAILVRLEHKYASDLTFTLTNPDETTITLAARRGSHGCFSETYPVAFADSAPTPAANMGDFFFRCQLIGLIDGLNTFAPDEPLSTLNGSMLQGSWTLSVADSAQGDDGSLRRWVVFVPEPTLGLQQLVALAVLLPMASRSRKRQAVVGQP